MRSRNTPCLGECFPIEEGAAVVPEHLLCFFVELSSCAIDAQVGNHAWDEASGLWVVFGEGVQGT